MKVSDKSISAWQLGILLFFLLFANKILALPALLFQDASIESNFVVLALFAFEMGVLFLFYKLKTKYPTESFEEVLTAHFGKVVQIVVYVFFMIFFLGKAVLLYNVTSIFFKNVIYKDYNNFLFLFCFIPIINHLATSGLRVMGRTAQLFFPLVLIIVIFCVVVGFFGINSTPLYFQTSFSQLCLTGLKHISSFGDIIFVFVVMDRVKIKKGQWKAVFSLVGLASALVLVISVVYMFSYTYTAFMHPYAIFEIMSYVKEYGGLGRIDLVSMVGIIIFSYFQLAIYLKAFMFSFEGVFKNVDKIYSVLTFDLALVVMVSFFIVNLTQSVLFAKAVLPYMTILSFVILPIVSGICLLWHKEAKNE